MPAKKKAAPAKKAAAPAKRKKTTKVNHVKSRSHLPPPVAVKDTTYWYQHPAKIPEKVWQKLLDGLRDHGIVTDACFACGISRKTFYQRKKEDEAFHDEAELAQAEGLKSLEDVAVKRATIGDEEPVYYQGEIVGHVNRRSDQLLMFLLQGRDARYKRKQEITGPDGSPFSVLMKMNDEDLNAEITRRMKELEDMGKA